jgi:hypothetical protein
MLSVWTVLLTPRLLRIGLTQRGRTALLVFRGGNRPLRRCCLIPRGSDLRVHLCERSDRHKPRRLVQTGTSPGRRSKKFRTEEERRQERSASDGCCPAVVLVRPGGRDIRGGRFGGPWESAQHD